MKSFVLVVLLGSAAIAAAATSPEATAQAKALYEQGSRHYDLREYREAVDAFRRAYDLMPDPLFLFNIAQAYRQLDDCENARMFYKAYLRNEPTADNRPQIERFVAAMDECSQKREAERKAAQQAAEPPPPVVMTRSDHSGARLAGILTASIGAVAVAGGVYFSLDAGKQSRTIEELCGGGFTTSDTAAIDRQGLDSERDSIILYGLGGAAIAAGAGMILWATLRSREPVVVTPTRSGATATVRF